MNSLDLETDSGARFETGKLLGKGGEGDVYEVRSSSHRELQQLVVKVYHPDKRTPERERKLRFMLGNPPHLAPEVMGHRSVVWPTATCRDHSGSFVGFTMPRMNLAKAEDLTLLCALSVHAGADAVWHRFARNAAEAFILRLRVGYNLAAALYNVHQVGNYVLVDFKPENVKIVGANGLVSLLDMDSIQITVGGVSRFDAPMSTPEYTPPEGQLGVPGASFLTHWDDFSLGVVLYKLFVGIHPFTGTCTGRFVECTETAAKIREGLFPHGSAGRHFRVVPAPQRLFSLLPDAIRDLFIQCFEAGHTNPAARPSAADWCAVLTQAKSAKANLGLVLCPASATPRRRGPVAPPPKIFRFSASASSVAAGHGITLSWKTAEADRVFISSVGGVALQGTLTLTPAGTTTYVLTAAGKGGQITQSLHVQVVDPPPVIVQFTATPNHLLLGDPVQLDWVTRNATAVQLLPGGGAPLPAQGSVTATPRASTEFQLVATSPIGTVSASVRVKVRMGFRAPTALRPVGAKLSPVNALCGASPLTGATASLLAPHALAPASAQLARPTQGRFSTTPIATNTPLLPNTPLRTSP